MKCTFATRQTLVLNFDSNYLQSQFQNNSKDRSRWLSKVRKSQHCSTTAHHLVTDEAYAKHLRNVSKFSLNLDSHNLPLQLQNNWKDTSRWISELGHNYNGAPQKPRKIRLADEANAKRLRNVLDISLNLDLKKPTFSTSKQKKRYVKMDWGTRLKITLLHNNRATQGW